MPVVCYNYNMRKPHVRGLIGGIALLILVVAISLTPNNEPLRIIHITDAHVNHSTAAWDDFVASGAWKKVDAVVDSGDFCDELTPEMIEQSKRVPRRTAYGNHELAFNSRDELEKMNPLIHYTKGWTIIMFPWWQEFEGQSNITEASINRLYWILATAKAPVLIVTHSPLLLRNHQTAQYFEKIGDKYGYDPKGNTRILDIISASGKVKAVLSGHYHQNYVALHRGILHIATTELAYGYRIIELSEHSISSRFVPSSRKDYRKSTGWFLFPKTLSPKNQVIGTPQERSFAFSIN